jgi:hypothetical protein
MAREVHLLKADAPALAGPLIARAAEAAGVAVTVVVMDASVPPALPAGVRVLRLGAEVDYDGVLDLLFEADRVVAW